jgi:hypothetical protein
MAVDRDGRAVVVWEDSWEPDLAAAPDGSFLIAWHEEQFPSVQTVVQTVRVGAPASR